MKVTGVLLLTLSAITPASSVFVIMPGVISQAGTGAFLALLAAALVALAISVVYAELASAFPHAGGEYAMLGRTLGPFTGYVFMGMNLVVLTLAPAVLALGAADYVTAVWPQARSVPLALGIVVASMLLGVLNIRVNAWVTGVFLAVEVLALVVLAVLGFGHSHNALAEFVLHPAMLTQGRLAPASFSAIGTATAVAIFSYNGFGQAVYFSEEMHEAPRLMARTILLALVLTVGFEFIPATAVLMGAPDLARLMSSAAPFSDFMIDVGGPTLNTVVGLGIALSIVNAVIASVLINARLLYATGRDGVWHGGLNLALTQMHRRFHSPWAANLIAGTTACACCFIPFSLLLVMNGAGIVVTYFLLCIAVVVGRVSGSTGHGHYRMPLYPLAPIVALIALSCVLYANWMDPAVGRPSLIFTGGLMAVAAVYFLILKRRRGGVLTMVDLEP